MRITCFKCFKHWTQCAQSSESCRSHCSAFETQNIGTTTFIVPELFPSGSSKQIECIKESDIHWGMFRRSSFFFFAVKFWIPCNFLSLPQHKFQQNPSAERKTNPILENSTPRYVFSAGQNDEISGIFSEIRFICHRKMLHEFYSQFEI